MARADTFTLLPLDTYAKIMGINPLHFNGARVPDVTPEPFTIQNAQRPLWHQFQWQDFSNVSHDELAFEIAAAEFDIKEFLGYWPAPRWVSQEMHQYPRPYRSEAFGNGRTARAQFKTIELRSGKVISPGRRNTTLIGTATVAGATMVFSDPNTDGWDTLVTITLPTTITDTSEIAVFFPNEAADQIWQIRPLKTITIAGGFVTITADSWLFFDPDVTDAIPTDERTAINASTALNYIQSIEVYREFTDFTQPQAQFFWQREPDTLRFSSLSSCCTTCSGTGCEACTLIAQDGCFAIVDVVNGVVAPQSATFDATDDRWEKVQWTECREPDQVKLWYYAGEQSERGLRGGFNKLDTILARNIAYLATARLNCEFRDNNNVQERMVSLQRNTAESFPDGSTIFTPPDILNNPFGTRVGEVQVYRSLLNMRPRRISVGAVA